jgi:hypothetical protein
MPLIVFVSFTRVFVPTVDFPFRYEPFLCTLSLNVHPPNYIFPKLKKLICIRSIFNVIEQIYARKNGYYINKLNIRPKLTLIKNKCWNKAKRALKDT